MARESSHLVPLASAFGRLYRNAAGANKCGSRQPEAVRWNPPFVHPLVEALRPNEFGRRRSYARYMQEAAPGRSGCSASVLSCCRLTETGTTEDHLLLAVKIRIDRLPPTHATMMPREIDGSHRVRIDPLIADPDLREVDTFALADHMERLK